MVRVIDAMSIKHFKQGFEIPMTDFDSMRYPIEQWRRPLFEDRGHIGMNGAENEDATLIRIAQRIDLGLKVRRERGKSFSMEILELVDDDDPILFTHNSNRFGHIAKIAAKLPNQSDRHAAVFKRILKRLCDTPFVAIGHLQIKCVRGMTRLKGSLNERGLADPAATRDVAEKPTPGRDDFFDFGLFGRPTVKAPALDITVCHLVSIINIMLTSRACQSFDLIANIFR